MSSLGGGEALLECGTGLVGPTERSECEASDTLQQRKLGPDPSDGSRLAERLIGESQRLLGRARLEEETGDASRGFERVALITRFARFVACFGEELECLGVSAGAPEGSTEEQLRERGSGPVPR